MELSIRKPKSTHQFYKNFHCFKLEINESSEFIITEVPEI